MRQDDTDLICQTLLKWHKEAYSGFWLDKNNEATLAISFGPDKFDPFANPADCATLMSECWKRGIAWEIHSGFAAIVGNKVNRCYAPSWTEAFCESTLLLIKSMEASDG